jgi:nitroreductase
MDVMEAIQKRRSIRHYKSDDIPEDVLDRLLNAMRLAPSGGNRQPWKFIVVRDKATKSKVTAACSWKTGDGNLISQNWIDEAPIIIVVCGLEEEAAWRYYKDGEVIITYRGIIENNTLAYQGFESCLMWDLAIALDHLTLAATAEGLGTCWIGGLNEPQLKAILDIPADVRAPMAVVVGYPVSWPEPRPRKFLDQIICYDKYN